MPMTRSLVLAALVLSCAPAAASAQAPAGPPGPPPGNGTDLPAPPGTAPAFVAARHRRRDPGRAGRSRAAEGGGRRAQPRQAHVQRCPSPARQRHAERDRQGRGAPARSPAPATAARAGARRRG